MAFKEVQDLSPDTVVSLGGTNRKTGKKNPTQVEGYYLGKREVADRKKKSGKSYIYVFQTEKGTTGVWGKTDLDRKMSVAEVGTMTRATYVGMAQTPNGEMYKYKVEVDNENTIDVGLVANTNNGPVEEGFADDAEISSGADQDDGYTNDDEGGTTEDTPTEEDEQETQAALAAAAAKRRDRTREILAGKGRKN